MPRPVKGTRLIGPVPSNLGMPLTSSLFPLHSAILLSRRGLSLETLWTVSSSAPSPEPPSTALAPRPGHGKTLIRKASINKGLEYILYIPRKPGNQPNSLALDLSCEPITDTTAEKDINSRLPQPIHPKEGRNTRPILEFDRDQTATVAPLKDQEPLTRIKHRRNPPPILRYSYLHDSPVMVLLRETAIIMPHAHKGGELVIL